MFVDKTNILQNFYDNYSQFYKKIGGIKKLSTERKANLGIKLFGKCLCYPQKKRGFGGEMQVLLENEKLSLSDYAPLIHNYKKCEVDNLYLSTFIHKRRKI